MEIPLDQPGRTRRRFRGPIPIPNRRAETGPIPHRLLGVLVDHVVQKDVRRLRDLHRHSPPPMHLARRGPPGGRRMLRAIQVERVHLVGGICFA